MSWNDIHHGGADTYQTFNSTLHMRQYGEFYQLNFSHFIDRFPQESTDWQCGRTDKDQVTIDCKAGAFTYDLRFIFVSNSSPRC